MAVWVVDTNVWLDFEAGGLLEAIVQLPYALVIADVIWEEELSPALKSSLDSYVTIEALAPDLLAKVTETRATFRGLSHADAVALTLAVSLDATLVTGDKELRAAGASYGVRIAGQLTFVDAAVERGLISPEAAWDALVAMLNADRRLPRDEVEKRRTQWVGNEER